MRTRRLVLTLLAVGLISSVCWVSVWAWAVAFRDVPKMQATVAGSYAAGQTIQYSLRVSGAKLVCVDIDSNAYYACDPWTSVNWGGATSCPNQGGNLFPPNFAGADPSRRGCNPQVTIRDANNPTVVLAGSDDTYSYNPPSAPWSAPTNAADDWDPFVCWFNPSAPAVSVYVVQVQDSVVVPIQGCSYYLMTVTSFPAQAGGTVVPIGGTYF